MQPWLLMSRLVVRGHQHLVLSAPAASHVLEDGAFVKMEGPCMNQETQWSVRCSASSGKVVVVDATEPISPFILVAGLGASDPGCFLAIELDRHARRPGWRADETQSIFERGSAMGLALESLSTGVGRQAKYRYKHADFPPLGGPATWPQEQAGLSSETLVLP